MPSTPAVRTGKCPFAVLLRQALAASAAVVGGAALRVGGPPAGRTAVYGRLRPSNHPAVRASPPAR